MNSKLERWVTCKEASDFLGVSRDTIERRRVPCQEDIPSPQGFVEHKLRFKYLELDEPEHAEDHGDPRYWFPDTLAMLKNPKVPRATKTYSPRFHV